MADMGGEERRRQHGVMRQKVVVVVPAAVDFQPRSLGRDRQGRSHPRGDEWRETGGWEGRSPTFFCLKYVGFTGVSGPD